MLKKFDTLRREDDATVALEGMDAFRREAFELVGSPKVQNALDLNQVEPQAPLRARPAQEQFQAAPEHAAGPPAGGRG